MDLKALRGTADLLPDALTAWTAVERTARHTAFAFGFQELRTPIIEDAALFSRTVGETTDIVQKEMFSFEDRGGRTIVLRPEGTAAVVRAYLEHNLDKTQGLAKLFYLGPMFRAERPQAGRFRQFHQFGVEAIGSNGPWLDVDVIALAAATLQACGLTSSTILVTSMGCRPDQERSRQLLRDRLAPVRAELCQECQNRFDKNIFRVLDCKNPTCRELAWKDLTHPFVLCAECQAHFDQVREGLRTLGIAFDDTQVFARGLDYYTRTVFEIRAQGLGAQDTVAAGGRYDHLVEELGGPPAGAAGFAAGIERLLMAVEAQGGDKPNHRRRGVYVALVKPDLAGRALPLVQALRGKGITASMDYDGRSLKAQLREADKLGCQWAAILGEQELAAGTVTVKDMTVENGTQRTVAWDAFITEAAGHKGQCHS